MSLYHGRLFALFVLALNVGVLSGCGGGGTSNTPPPPPPPSPVTYSIGGTISGLPPHADAALTNNGGDEFTVTGVVGKTTMAFTFPHKLTSGSAYSVSAVSYGLVCKVSQGSGLVTADVTGVAVTCSSDPPGSSSGYTVGGTVTGLVGHGLNLDIYNAANTGHHSVLLGTIGIDANGAYAAPRAQDGYGVLIGSEPQSPTQDCVVRFPWGSYLFDLAPLPDHITNVDISCGAYAFVANGTTDTIASFGVDATSGALAPAGAPVSTGQAPSGIAMSRDKRFLYVSDSGGNDISGFVVDPATGTLTAVAGSPFATGAAPATLIRVSTVTVSYGPPVLEDYIYVADKGSNEVRVYRIDQVSGALNPMTPATYATGAGPVALSVAATGQVSVLYAANQDDGSVSAFQIDESSGALTPVQGSPFPVGAGASTLAVGGGQNHMYVLAGSGNSTTIRGFSIKPPSGHADDGALGNPTTLDVSLPSCSSIIIDNKGAYLYAAAGSFVYEFAIDPQTGELTPLAGSPVAIGASAGSLSIDPTNQFLYVANGGTGTLTGFALNSTNGALTPLSGSPYSMGGAADVVLAN